MGQSVSRQRLVGGIVVAGGLAVVIVTCLQQVKASDCLQQDEASEETQEEPAMTPEEIQAKKEANARMQKDAEHRVLSEAVQAPPFNLLESQGILGAGDFGSMELVKLRQSGQTFSMKRLDKGHIIKTGMQESVCRECLILKLIKSPFVLRLYGTYNLKQQVVLLLEPCLGGELYFNYNRHNFRGSESHARYYIGSVVLGLCHIHAANVVYRDLKPENCLLDSGGRLKLSDMGLAKVIAGMTFTLCGTPDYFAPELIQNKGHNFAVDWWCTGVLLFEFLAGHPPFEAAYPMKIYQNVLQGIEKVAFPEPAKRAETLIRGLLKRNSKDRLPMRKGGIDTLKNHPWYGSFDWVGLENQSHAPPFVPKIKSQLPATSDRSPATYEDDGTGWADVFGVELNK